MKTESIIVDPFDLEAMPVDELRIVDLLSQIEAVGGIGEPVTVWMHSTTGDILVINGFHRAECARRLGYSELKATLIDCDESTFWDMRISATTEHRAVTDDRLHLWMLDAWMLTEWAKLNPATFARTAYQVYVYIYNQLERPDQLTEQQRSIVEWFNQRAVIWAKSPKEIAKIILDKSGLLLRYSDLLDVAAMRNIDYTSYCKAVETLSTDTTALTSGIKRRDIGKFITANIGHNEWRTITQIKADERQATINAEIQRHDDIKKPSTLVTHVSSQLSRLRSVQYTVDDIVNGNTDYDACVAVNPAIDDQVARFLSAADTLAEWAGVDRRWKTSILKKENARLREQMRELQAKLQHGPIIVPDSALAKSSSDIRY